MRCRKVRSFLSIYVNGETAPKIRIEIENHLKGCKSCRREAEVYRSLENSIKAMPEIEASEGFNAQLFEKIGREGFKEARGKAYMPGKIPRFDRTKVAAFAMTAIIVLALGIGVGFNSKFLGSSPQMANTSPATDRNGDDLYLTVQPTDNPFLNERKSVSQMIQQYNRFREYSRSLRASSTSGRIIGNGTNASLASAYTNANQPMGIRVRPVVKNYISVP